MTSGRPHASDAEHRAAGLAASGLPAHGPPTHGPPTYCPPPSGRVAGGPDRACLPGFDARRLLAAVGLGAVLLPLLWLLLGQVVIGRAGERPYQVFLRLFIGLDLPAAWASLVVGLLATVAALATRQADPAAACPPRAQRLLERIEARPGLLAAIAFCAYALGARWVFQAHALSGDEYAVRLQGEIFAAGRLAGQWPPELAERLLPGLLAQLVRVSPSGEVITNYWPATSLVMAPLAWLGVPWLLDAVLTAAMLPLLARLLARLVDDPAARGFALLATALSPAIAFNAMSQFPMPLLLLASVAHALLVLRGSRASLLAAGLVGSVALTAGNPLPHLLYALPWIAWIAWKSPRRWRDLAWLAAGYLPLSALLGLGWPLLLRAFGPGVVADVLSAGPGQPADSPFSFPTLNLLGARAVALAKLDLWAVPGLLPLAMAGALTWRHRLAPVLLACALSTWIGYLFVRFDQGNGWGYRYAHAAWFVLPVLAAAAYARIADAPGLRGRMAAFAATACAGTIAVILPLRVWQVHGHFERHLAQLPPPVAQAVRQLVFVRQDCGYHVADLVQNDPLLRGPELRMLARTPAEDEALVRRLWPQAIRAASGPCGERWVLEPAFAGQRSSIDASR